LSRIGEKIGRYPRGGRPRASDILSPIERKEKEIALEIKNRATGTERAGEKVKAVPGKEASKDQS